jgi:hypothetical protein
MRYNVVQRHAIDSRKGRCNVYHDAKSRAGECTT